MSAAGPSALPNDQQKWHQYKNYAAKNGINTVMESMLSNLFNDQPEDPYEYMTQFINQAGPESLVLSQHRPVKMDSVSRSKSPARPEFQASFSIPPPIKVDLGNTGSFSTPLKAEPSHQLQPLLAQHTPPKNPDQYLRVCCKIFVTHVMPCYSMPWQRGEEGRGTGSGFPVVMPHTGERRILTNCHVVENHSLVQVRRAGFSEKFVAKVICIGYDCDIAILDVEDPRFWEDMPLVNIGSKVPQLTSEVVAVGFPMGGDDVSATRGVVSRVLVGGLIDNLCVQIDAAINPGNSGGPVFDNNCELVGIAFSGLLNSNNIGYIIPLPVINSFLTNFRVNGNYLGKCTDCFEIQPMENPNLRRKFGMTKAQQGVLITKIPKESPVKDVLEERDILMGIDNVPIANDGTIDLPESQDTIRVTFSYLVYRVPKGHRLRCLVLRDNKPLIKEVVAQPQPDLLLVSKAPLPKPTYVVVGGLVFVPLMQPYESLMPRKKLSSVLKVAEKPGQQIVMLLMVLRAEINIGYEDLIGMVKKFNGEEILNLKDLKDKVFNVKDGELMFELETGELIVMDAKACAQAEAAIFSTHCIPARCSASLE